MLFLYNNLFSIICGGIAGYLVINQISGWGWFLFAE